MRIAESRRSDRLRIALDPRLKECFGPEIAWAWRLVLIGAGIPWVEVALDDPECDVAYVADFAAVPACRLLVRADPARWSGRATLGLAGHAPMDGCTVPLFESETAPPPPRLVDGRLVYERDVIFDIFWLATGQEEPKWPRNRHGHICLPDDSPWEDVWRLALASGLASSLELALDGLGFEWRTPRWPGGARAAVCLTHDVDYPETRRLLEPLRVLRRRGRAGLRPALAVLAGTKTHWHFRSWTREEQALGVHSAFYFSAEAGSLWHFVAGRPDPFYDVGSQRFRRLLAQLASEGCEVGLHASYRAFESQERLAREKAALEEACGQAVVGNRHHYWHLNPDDPEATLLLHEQVGLAYDTSLAHERYVGWRRGLSWPFFPFHQKQRRELRTLQLTTAWMDSQLFVHRAPEPDARHAVLEDIVDRTAAQGGCLTVDVHEYVFDGDLFPGWADAYRGLLKHVAARGDFWIATPREAAEHWARRAAAICTRSSGLGI